MKITAIEVHGAIPTVRHCRKCGMNVTHMGKKPKFCPGCGRKLIDRMGYISPDEVAEILEAHYAKKEGEAAR